jgi:acetoin utilization deacetylase AcuC-like enzyme
MTLLYTSPEFLGHDTGDHPECAGRLLPTMRQLHKSAYLFPLVRPRVTPISARRLNAVHPLPYVESLRQLAEHGGGKVDEDTVISPKSFEVACLAAGAVCDAVERVVQGDDKHAFCLIRPPGHHALPSRAMGFCLLANAALGARVAIDELNLDRVLIVDWDVHHGNGTQAIFWEDAQVGFLSIHRYPYYPGGGATDETGTGPGLGTTLNVPVKFGTSRSAYLATFTAAVETFADRIKPQLVIISAGFDAHRLDPYGSLGLESEDFANLTQVVLDVARVHAGGRIVSVLEGGYHPAALAESIEIHLHEMSDDR